MKILDDIAFSVDGSRFQHRIQDFQLRGLIVIVSIATEVGV
jgi:hypothetical protein